MRAPAEGANPKASASWENNNTTSSETNNDALEDARPQPTRAIFFTPLLVSLYRNRFLFKDTSYKYEVLLLFALFFGKVLKRVSLDSLVKSFANDAALN